MIILKYFSFPNNLQKDTLTKAASVSRILLCLILLHRHIDLLLGSPINNSQISLIVSTIIFLIFTLFGFFTFLTMPIFVLLDNLISWNLSSQLVVILSISIWLSNGWLYLSFDQFLCKRFLIYGKIISFANCLTFNAVTLRNLSLLLWGGLVFTNVFFHLNDPNWINGTVIFHLLRTPYYNDFYYYFFSINDSLLIIISKITAYGMIIWELFLWMLPGIKRIRQLTFIWGLMFFLGCIFLLNLSYLPYLEIIFWLFLYCPDKLSYLFFRKNKFIKNNKYEYQNSFKILDMTRNFIKFNLFFCFLFGSLSNALIIYSPNYHFKNYLSNVLHNKYFRKWNKLWGHNSVNDFNESDLLSSRYSICICRVLDNGDKELVPWQDQNGGRLSYLSNDNFYLKSLSFNKKIMRLNYEEISNKLIFEKEINKIVSLIIEFDMNINNKRRIAGYDVFFIEHFPKYKDGFLAGWTIDDASLVHENIFISKNSIVRKNKLPVLEIPPSYFHYNYRRDKTSKFKCGY